MSAPGSLAAGRTAGGGWRWRAGLLGSCCVLLGCSARRAPLELETRMPGEASTRRAPGVSIDRAPALPSARETAHPAQGLLVLSTPADPAAAREVVRRFFQAVVAESMERMRELLDPGAHVQTGSMGQRIPALPFWAQRLERLDYAPLGGQTLFRERELQTYRGEDLSRLEPPRRFPVAVPSDAVLVQVPLVTTRDGRTRLFGESILFLLRSRDGDYRISEMVEDFQLP